MREWLGELAQRAVSEMGTELKHMGAHGRHASWALHCLTRVPSCSTREVIMTMARKLLRLRNLNSLVAWRCSAVITATDGISL